MGRRWAEGNGRGGWYFDLWDGGGEGEELLGWLIWWFMTASGMFVASIAKF